MRGKNRTVYRKITARITELGMTRSEVSDKLGVTVGTFHNKLCGFTPFTLPEAIQIRRILQMQEPLENCFVRIDEK